MCLIYPVLILCYAGQASYISKNLHVKDFNHLSESVPGKLCFSTFCVGVEASLQIHVSNV